MNLTFDVADLAGRLPEHDASVDLTLCLYSALSHLPVARLPEISKEIARVTSGYFITTVRPIGSMPTAFVDSIEKVRRLKQDHVRDRCEIDLSDGRHIAFSFHQFTAVELRNHFASCFDIEDVRGLDLFIADLCRISGGIPSLRQAIASLPMNLSGSRRRMPPARSSWIAPPISCSWRAAGEPLRLPPVSLRRPNTAIFVWIHGRSRRVGGRTHETARVLRSRVIASGRPRTLMIRPVAS